MRIILSHPTANNFVKATVARFAEEKLIYEFYTSIASFPGDFLDRISIGPLSEIRRRRFDRTFKPFTRTWPYFEWGRMLAIKLGADRLVRHEAGFFSLDSVYRNIDRKVSRSLRRAFKKGARIVYAYEDGALATFQQAKALGMRCIYDLPISYWEFGRKLMREEAERLPSWTQTLGGGLYDSAAKLERKTKELSMADLVVCPSRFVLDSLPVWAKDKKAVIAPFGSPIAYSSPKNTPTKKRRIDHRPLRVLFCGSMGQRKGLADLFEAIRLINSTSIELVVMGSLLAPMGFYRSVLPDFVYERGRPNKEVLDLMRSCDVFCLPSIVEGRALVMQEAMSQGLPLIITPNTGGEDLVIEGKTGFMVPIRSPQMIAQKLTWFMENRRAIPDMAIMAQEYAAKYTWKDYTSKIVEAASALL